MKIVTHAGRAHLDDFLSVALLLYKYPTAEVLRLNSIEEIVEKDSIFVDFGGIYDPPQYLDHHVDVNLPASFVLVLQYYYPEIYEKVKDLPEINHLSDVDTAGPHYAMKKYNYSLPSFQIKIIETIVLEIFSSETIITPKDWLHIFLIEIGKNFVEYLEELLRGIEIVKNSPIKNIEGIKVIFLTEQVDPSLVRRVYSNVDIAVMSSCRNPGGFSLVRLTDDNKIDFRNIKNNIPTFFVHPNGFMAVVEKSYIEDAIRLSKLSNNMGL